MIPQKDLGFFKAHIQSQIFTESLLLLCSGTFKGSCSRQGNHALCTRCFTPKKLDIVVRTKSVARLLIGML